VKKRILAFVLLILLIFTVVGCNNQDTGEYVAKVNGQVITLKDFEARLSQVAAINGFDLENPQMAAYKDMFELQTLDGMIDELLLLTEAKNRKLEVKKEDLTDQISGMKSQFASDKEFSAYLKDYMNMTEKEFEKILEDSLLVQALFEDVTKDINSTDVDIEEYYNENKEAFYQEEQIRARHILVKTKEEAAEIIKLITEEGQDMGELAMLKSTEEAAKTTKGDLGYFGRGRMVKPFEDAAFALDVGEITQEPVETTFGWHVIRVEDKKAAYQQTFEEVKDDLEQSFINEAKNNAFIEFMADIKEKAEIENKLQEEIQAKLEKASQELEEQQSKEAENGGEDNSEADTEETK
jgi:parvulin-like peptidyl-prolyl isomerase